MLFCNVSAGSMHISLQQPVTCIYIFPPYLYFLIFVVVVFHTVNMVSGTNHLYNVGFTYFFNLEINDKLEAN